MFIDCIGTGEALDFNFGNSCFLVRGDCNVLVDCGFASVHPLVRRQIDPEALDVIHLTHLHADHCFGLPAFLMHLCDGKRKRPLIITGVEDTEHRVMELVNQAYSSLLSRLEFELQFKEEPQEIKIGETILRFAPTAHSQRNLAITIAHGDKTFGISGDGGLTDSSKTLFQDCTLLLHEAYLFDERVFGHGCTKDLIDYCSGLQKLKLLGLIHIQKKFRTTQFLKDLATVNSNLNIVVPSAGTLLS